MREQYKKFKLKNPNLSQKYLLKGKSLLFYYVWNRAMSKAITFNPLILLKGTHCYKQIVSLMTLSITELLLSFHLPHKAHVL